MIIFDSSAVRHVESFGAGILDLIPRAMRPAAKASERPVGPPPPAPAQSRADRHAAGEFAPRSIDAAELAETGPVEDVVHGPMPIRPSKRPTGPTPEDVAWLHGYEGGRQGFDAAEPEDCSPDELIAWNAGKFSGQTDRWNAARNARILAEA